MMVIEKMAFDINMLDSPKKHEITKNMSERVSHLG